MSKRVKEFLDKLENDFPPMDQGYIIFQGGLFTKSVWYRFNLDVFWYIRRIHGHFRYDWCSIRGEYEQLVDEQTKYGPESGESDAEVGVRAAAMESQPVPKMVQEAAHEGRTLRHVSRYEAFVNGAIE